MRILAVVPSILDTSPGQRYRLEQWDPYLRKSGVEITYEPFECQELHHLVYQPGSFLRKVGLVSRAFLRRWRLLDRLQEFDAVYIFREAALLGPAILEQRINRLGPPIIFDFDDAIFIRYRSPSNGYLSYLKFAGKTQSICRMAAHIIVGNSYLADYAKQFNPRVSVIPTTIDTDKYQVERKNGKAIPVIGWTGSFSTVQHLDTLRGALSRLARSERFRLRVIGTSTYTLEGVEVEASKWCAATEIEELSEIDIGIMPLPDEPWSRGKCGLKALQFMALGLPTVCSPVGVNTDIIQDGENGFIASSEDEWIRKLSLLLNSPLLRGKIGNAARATVVDRYSAHTQAPRFFQVLDSVVRSSKSFTPET